MSATLLVRRDDVRVFHATWAELLAILPYRDDGTKCDAVLVDAPYSTRTHEGHDGGAMNTNRMLDYAGRNSGSAKDRRYAARKAERAGQHRRELDYAAWTPEDVDAFVDAWAPVTRGWMVSQTDDVLFPIWRAAMARHDRQTFQDVPAIIGGMSVRLTGDGPSSWAIHHAVSRPRSREFATWGTLRGGYTGPSEAQASVGGKPLWLMEALIRDYSRHGDLVIDPCCGKGGTTLRAALMNGRIAIGGDASREAAEGAARVVDRMVQRPLFASDRSERMPRGTEKQPGLFDEVGT